MRDGFRRNYGGAHACVLMVLALLAGLTACGERAVTYIAPGNPFPAAALVSLTGKDVFSLDALRGKPVVINFWATWCEPCRKEMHSLERLHREANAHGLVVIGVSVDTDLNLAREFLLQHELTFPNYSDDGQTLTRDLLKIQAFPATFLVAADGTVRAHFTGARDWASPDTMRLLGQTLNTPVAEK